jgi:uncharacterized protein (DUF169 family)
MSGAVSTPFGALFERFLSGFSDDVRIPVCGLKFVRHDEPDPKEAFAASPEWCQELPRTLASCGYSYKAARGGLTLRADRRSIGCPAGALSLGLVSSQSHDSFEGGCYVKPMREPATPADFTAGHVYAPHQSGHPEFALFGDSDCGRYETLDAARRAISEMPVIPPVMQAVYYYHPALSGVDVEPDLVHIYCTPLEAMRMIQGYSFPTGERFRMSCIGIRGVSCDMTAWPYVRQEINGTFLCLGARGITGWPEEYVGFGMPYSIFKAVVDGLEKSRTGFPYDIFPRMPLRARSTESHD